MKYTLIIAAALALCSCGGNQHKASDPLADSGRTARTEQLLENLKALGVDVAHVPTIRIPFLVDASPYMEAEPLLNTYEAEYLLRELQHIGYKLGIISWTSKGGSKIYNKITCK